MDVTDVTAGPIGGLPARAVQLPVSLPSQLHGQLTRWCRQTASELNVTALARGDVLEALLAELVTDADTADAVRRRLLSRLAPQPPVPQPPASWRGPASAGRLRGLAR